MKNILGKILPRPRRLALASGFNKVAMVGNVAVTGYAINGKSTAVILSGLTLLYYCGTKLGMSRLMKQLKGQGPQGVEVSDGELVREILELKDKAGLDGELHLVSTHEPGKQMGTVQFPDGSIVLDATSELLSEFSQDEILAASAHEFGHVKHGDTQTRQALEKSRRYMAAQMYVFGAMHSLFSLSPIPLLSSFAGTKVHKILIGVDNRIAEYRADDFAARLVGADKMADTLKRFLLDNLKILPYQAIGTHMKRLRFLPQIMRKQITERKIPGVLVEADIALNKVFDVSHPPMYKRLKALEGVAEEQGITINYSDFKSPQKTRACKGCMSLDNDARRANISSYARQLFRDEFGHRDIEIEFFDCGRDRSKVPEVVVMQVAPGAILEISLQGSGEHMPDELREALENGNLPPELEDMVRDMMGGVFPPDAPGSDADEQRPGQGS